LEEKYFNPKPNSNSQFNKEHVIPDAFGKFDSTAWLWWALFARLVMTISEWKRFESSQFVSAISQQNGSSDTFC
jgi:hypothetical protein